MPATQPVNWLEMKWYYELFMCPPTQILHQSNYRTESVGRNQKFTPTWRTLTQGVLSQQENKWNLHFFCLVKYNFDQKSTPVKTNTCWGILSLLYVNKLLSDSHTAWINSYIWKRKQHTVNKDNCPICTWCTQNTTGSFFALFWCFVLAATNIIIMQSHWEDKPTIPRGAAVKLMCWTECNSWKKTKLFGWTHSCQELKPVQDLSIQCGWTQFKLNVQSPESTGSL